ncbi:protein kinase family protein [Kytococcus sp. Marseille-QA3725]
MLPLQTGTIVNGRYRLLHPGQEVEGVDRWVAEDTTLRRQVDLWITPEDGPRSPAAQDAARRAALVEDGRLPRVLDIGVEDGIQWVTTQHDARAETLVELVEDAPLPPGEARRLVGEAARALEVARRHGVHHTALGPQLLERDATGGVRVTGLGLVAALTGSDVLGDDAAALSDTRDLVALLHTALTGTWPGSLPVTGIATGAPSRPSRVVDHVPHDLDELCAQLGAPGALEIDGTSVSTPGELAEVLRPWNGSTVTGRGRLRPGAGAGGALAGAGAAGTVGGGAAAAAASDAPTTAVPLAIDAPTQGIATGAAADQGARGVDGRSDGGTGTSGEAGNGDGSRRRPGPLLLVAGSLLALGAVALAATTLPDLLGGDDRGDETAVESPAPDDSGAPASSTETGDDTDGAEPSDQGSDTGSAPQESGSTSEADDSAATPVDDETGKDTAHGGSQDGTTPGAPTDEPTADEGSDDRAEAPSSGDTAPTDDHGAPDPSEDGADGTGADGPDGSATPSSSDTPSSSAPSTPSPSSSPGTSSPPPDSKAPDGGWAIADIVGYDPGHDGDEHTDWTNRINNPSSPLPWSTHKYDHPPFGGYTDALGLRVDLGEVREVSSVDIGMPEGDWRYEVKVGPSRDIGRAVTLGSPRGGGDATWTPDEPVQGQYVFVWFTDTAPTGDGRWAAELEDITVH